MDNHDEELKARLQQPFSVETGDNGRSQPLLGYYDQTQAPGWGDVGPLPQDSAKMIVETLCVAQSAIGAAGGDRKMEHIERLQRLIDSVSRQHQPFERWPQAEVVGYKVQWLPTLNPKWLTWDKTGDEEWAMGQCRRLREQGCEARVLVELQIKPE